MGAIYPVRCTVCYMVSCATSAEPGFKKPWFSSPFINYILMLLHLTHAWTESGVWPAGCWISSGWRVTFPSNVCLTHSINACTNTNRTTELGENDRKPLWWNGRMIRFQLVTANHSLGALSSCSLLDKNCSANCILNRVKNSTHNHESCIYLPSCN